MTTTDQDRTRRDAARAPLHVPDGLFGKAMAWYSRRTYGDVLDPGLKALAEVASASVIGCSWCLDFGWFQAHRKGLDVRKVEVVPRWAGVRRLHRGRAAGAGEPALALQRRPGADQPGLQGPV